MFFLMGNSDVFGYPFDITRLSEGYPADFGQEDAFTFDLETLWKGEAVFAPRFLNTGTFFNGWV